MPGLIRQAIPRFDAVLTGSACSLRGFRVLVSPGPGSGQAFLLWCFKSRTHRPPQQTQPQEAPDDHLSKGNLNFSWGNRDQKALHPPTNNFFNEVLGIHRVVQFLRAQRSEKKMRACVTDFKRHREPPHLPTRCKHLMLNILAPKFLTFFPG